MPFLTHISIALVTSLLSAAADVALQLSQLEGPAPLFREPAAGMLEFEGPMALLATPTDTVPDGKLMLEFDYFCADGLPFLLVQHGPPFEKTTAGKLPAISRRETWGTYTARLNDLKLPPPENWKQLRLDLPLASGSSIQIRNARLRVETAEDSATSTITSTDPAALESYLAAQYDGQIHRVIVEANSITISGTTTSPLETLHIAEIPMETLITDVDFESTHPITRSSDGTFSITVPRTRERHGRKYDRLTSRWQLIDSAGAVPTLHSHARYADKITSRSPDLPPAKPANKKGLGGWTHGHIPDELDQLGVTAVTVNLMVHSLISLSAEPGTTPYQWQGRTYHARNSAVAELDKTFTEAAKHNAMVSAILLIANPAKSTDPVVQMLGNPDAHRDGIFAMPNVTSEEGISLYGGILNYMAERWSRADGVFGRVHHWIVHNEVDAGWVWTNAGEISAISFMDLYHRSMRLIDLIARQYDPNSRPFISLTHHWADAGEARWYGSKQMIDLLTRFCKAEGNFPWAVAYHPYPQNLFNPRAWEDDQATFSFETKKITPKNIEVLDFYMKQPDLLFEGKVRPVHLSENGFNSKDYSSKELEDQAAGMAMAWKKISSLSSIESWQYHNWIDNRGEGGLRIGLRKFPDEPGDPLGKKPIWHLYQALGTETEDKACAPYLKTIGVESWNELIYHEMIN